MVDCNIFLTLSLDCSNYHNLENNFMVRKVFDHLNLGVQYIARIINFISLTGCYIMYLIVIGTIKSYGILYTELDEYYNVGSGPVALIGSLFLGCLFGLGK